MANKGMRKPEKWLTTKCAVCGKDIVHPVCVNRVTCSRACMKKHLAAQKKRKTCPSCGKEFVPHRRETLYCSGECYRKRQGKEEFKKRECVVCGNPFLPTHRDTRTCSLDCRFILRDLNQQMKDAERVEQELKKALAGQSYAAPIEDPWANESSAYMLHPSFVPCDSMAFCQASQTTYTRLEVYHQ